MRRVSPPQLHPEVRRWHATAYDGRNLGLLRDSTRIALGLLGLAAVELVLAILVDTRLPVVTP